MVDVPRRLGTFIERHMLHDGLGSIQGTSMICMVNLFLAAMAFPRTLVWGLDEDKYRAPSRNVPSYA